MRFITLILFSVFLTAAAAQTHDLTFAVVTDLHVGQKGAGEAAISTVNDINQNPDISFVLVTGDITSFGTDEQLLEAKEILDRLNKKYYAIPGNHESVWSESGGAAFLKIFGPDRFKFEEAGYFFIGTDCGPVLRHGLAHVSTSSLAWTDSVLSSLKNKNMPVIYANHYPMDSKVDNSYEVMKILKDHNVQLMLCGHGHRNQKFNFSGIPGIMCRSNLPGKGRSGYNIVKINNGRVTFSERIPETDSLLQPWAAVDLKSISRSEIKLAEPDYSVNRKYNNIKVNWEYRHQDDISGGFVVDKGILYTGTFDGSLLALDQSSGKKLWSYHAGGRIFSTPAVSGNRIVFTSTEGYVYCVSKQGKLLWKYASKKPVVSSPLINNDRVYTGFSDHSFRCLDLSDGSLIWDFNEVEGFVQTALLYNNMVYFGAWDSNIYALDQNTGKLKWKWSNQRSRAYSPAMAAPIGAYGRIFTVTPDYYITCFDAESGEIIWRETKDDIPVWFSSGLSEDSTLLFVKTRNNRGAAVSTTAPAMQAAFNTAIPINNDSSPTRIPEKGGTVFFSSNNGNIIAVSKHAGEALWEYKAGGSSINKILPVKSDEFLVSTNEGKIVSLKITGD